MNGEVVKLKYHKSVADNYRYKGGTNNNNKSIDDGGKKYEIGLKSACRTTWWIIIVFDFFI